MNDEKLRALSGENAVTSTYLASFGFRNGQLATRWLDGTVIVYTGVPSTVVEALLGSSNAGSWLRKEARAAAWPWRKVHGLRNQTLTCANE